MDDRCCDNRGCHRRGHPSAQSGLGQHFLTLVEVAGGFGVGRPTGRRERRGYRGGRGRHSGMGGRWDGRGGYRGGNGRCGASSPCWGAGRWGATRHCGGGIQCLVALDLIAGVISRSGGGVDAGRAHADLNHQWTTVQQLAVSDLNQTNGMADSRQRPVRDLNGDGVGVLQVEAVEHLAVVEVAAHDLQGDCEVRAAGLAASLHFRFHDLGWVPAGRNGVECFLRSYGRCVKVELCHGLTAFLGW